MYEAQFDKKGKFQPGPKAKWDANWREQEKCDHPFGSMRWGANKVCVFATCGKCSLRSAVHWTIKKTESSAASHSNGPEESASGEPRGSGCSTPQEPKTPPPPPALKKEGVMMNASEEDKTQG